MRCAIALCLGFLVLASAATARISESTNEPADTGKALQWRDGKTLRLPVSGATLTASAPVRQLTGRDAARVWTAVSGGPAPAGIEALLHDPRTGEMVIFQNLGRGGFEKLIWGGKAMFASRGNLLKIGQANFAFPVGGRYTDYQVGDRLSEHGIASTIAAILRMKEPVE